jgi:hypothetical protein
VRVQQVPGEAQHPLWKHFFAKLHEYRRMLPASDWQRGISQISDQLPFRSHLSLNVTNPMLVDSDWPKSSSTNPWSLEWRIKWHKETAFRQDYANERRSSRTCKPFSVCGLSED